MRPLMLTILLSALLPITASHAQELEAFGEEIDVRVLNLEVAVTDEDGGHIEGLGPGDFRLLVDGNEVPIEYFSEVRYGAALDAGTAEAVAGSTVPSLPPGKIVGTSFLLFIDDYFGLARDRKIVLENMLATIPRLGPKDRMAVVSFDGRKLHLVGNWETSHRAIARNLRQAMSAKPGGLQRRSELSRYTLQLRQLGSGLIEESLESIKVEYVRALSQQVDTVVKAATAAMRAMAKPPGRKVMLLASGGWPYDPSSYAVGPDPRIRNRTKRFSPKPAFDDLIATANKLSYTINTIDMAGRQAVSSIDAGNVAIVGDDFAQQAPTTVPDGPGGLGPAGPQPTPEEVTGQLLDDVILGFSTTSGREQEVEGPLIALAEETGGQAMINSFRSTALPRTLEGTSSYYWLGYTPTWARDDKAHKVRVEVLRDDVKIRSRKSFRDLSRESEVTMMVESNLLFDTDLRGHTLEAELGAAKRKRGKRLELPLSLKIPMDKVLMLPVAGGFEANLELRVAVIDEKGARSEIPVIPVKLGGESEPPAGAHAWYDTKLVLRNIQQQLSVVLYDVAGEKMLSTSIDFNPGSS
ncbi:MAG: VWA domain-containing protein [Acidobacteriota bacterium]